jgi:hypothetical protein
MSHAQDDLDGIQSIEKLASWARWFIWAITGIIGLFFTWVQLKDVPFVELAQKTPPQALTTTALIIYYACWIGGTNFDVGIQQRAYVADPKRGNITANTIGVTVVFLCVTALLLWVSMEKDIRLFALVLGLFVVANIFGWRHIVSRVRPAINTSRGTFRERRNFFRLEQLNLVDRYMTGKWQMQRFWSMLAMVLVINLFCSVEGARTAIATAANSLGIDLPVPTLANLVPGLSILAFVLIAETWIWAKRINVRTALTVLDGLRTEYKLERADPH